MDEPRERLIDILLREQLGGEPPPDLTIKILARAFPSRRPWLRPALMAASVLLAVGILTWWFWPRYPEPRATGSFEVVGGGKIQRGALVRTKDKTAALELGGYSRVEMKPGSTVRIEGEKYAESVALETGEVNCGVDSGIGSFGVKTTMGKVTVRGTEFTVRVAEEKTVVIVRVTGGAVALGGEWGDARFSAGEEQLYVFGKDKKPEARSGTLFGTVTAKAEGWIEVKAASDEKTRRYTPVWVGGERAGLDQTMIQTIARTPVGSRVKLEWKTEERPRVTKLEVVQAPDGKDGDKKSKTK
jgi:ferric-dicitrate binding protein FerR (iron transport regulator)